MKQNNIVVGIIITLVLIVVGAMFVVGRPTTQPADTVGVTSTPAEEDLETSLEELDNTELDRSFEKELEALDSNASTF